MSLKTLTSEATAPTTITVNRATITEDSEGFPDESYAAVSALTNIEVRMYQPSQAEVQRYGKGADHRTTQIVYIDGDVDIRPTDTITASTKTYRVIEVDKAANPSGSLKYTKVVVSASENSSV